MVNFRAKGQRARAVEFFGAMGGETIGRPAQTVAEHCDHGGIGAEMRVQMFDAAALQLIAQVASFGKIDEMPQKPRLGPACGLSDIP